MEETSNSIMIIDKEKNNTKTNKNILDIFNR